MNASCRSHLPTGITRAHPHERLGDHDTDDKANDRQKQLRLVERGLQAVKLT